MGKDLVEDMKTITFVEEYLMESLRQLGYVKIVQCRDCKYYTGKWCTKNSTKQFDMNDICKADDDFCSRAERRNDETD